jgi:DNA primase
MSLPPGFLDELRARTSLAHVAGRKVTWDRRKSNPGRGDLWAPCPFHQEKTASFHVDDRKGYYHCFGCQAGGDVFKFVQETENLGFMEVVEQLAREAGMPLPARDPKAQEKLDRQGRLAEVMEQALRHFRLQLRTAAAAPARDYLAGRGLSAEACERWEIGFAPDAWTHLRDHLAGKGVAPDLLLAAGLVKTTEKRRDPYDVFRNRIIFPIRDARGRCIAFGGRAMDPADGAKYLNSPETELFDKGRTLFNHGPARAAAGKGQPLLVAEGYMDVIALSEAGFRATVAPLGTAITADQLQLLWRIHPEPIVALDGDKAGLNAAMRLVDLALPLLEGGRSLRFAILPDGQDPDDLIRAQGAAAMQAVVDASRPMVDLLWRRETEGRVFDSPERRTALEAALRDGLRKIPDTGLRRHYGEELDRLRRALFFPPRASRAGGDGAPRGGGRFPQAPARPLPATRGSLLAAAGGGVEEQIREAVILAALVVNPWLVHRFAGELERLVCVGPDHGQILSVLLHLGPGATQAQLVRELGEPALEKLFSARHVQVSAGFRHSGDPDVAEQCVKGELEKLFRARGVRSETREAEADIAGLADEGITWRLRQAAEGFSSALRGVAEDKTEFVVADNGVRISKDERSASEALFAAIDFARGGRRTGRSE